MRCDAITARASLSDISEFLVEDCRDSCDECL